MGNPLKLAEVAVDLGKPVARALAEEASALLAGGAKGGKTAVKEFADSALASGGSDMSSLGGNWLARARGVANPYLEEFNAVQINPRYRHAIDVTRGRIDSTSAEYSAAYKEQLHTRYGLVHKYAWAVPNAEALAAIGEQGRIVEAGAGSGYWSHLLRQMKSDVVAFDFHGMELSANRFHSSGHAWTEILKGDASAVKQYGDRSLFMSFPPADDPFAHQVLRNFKGDRFVYVGEPAGGVTGDTKFHNLLAQRWRATKSVEIPRWEASDGFLQDELTVFERK